MENINTELCIVLNETDRKFDKPIFLSHH